MPYGRSAPPPPPDPWQRRAAHPPPQWQPPRPRSGGAGVVVGVVFGMVALVFTGIVVIGAVAANLRRADTVAVPAFTAPPRPTFRPAEPRDRRTSAPARTASSGDGRNTGDAGDAGDTGDAGSTRDTGDTTRTRVLDTSLEGNTLYRAGGLPRVHCPAGSPSIYSHAQLKALILRTSKCLDRGWSRILREQGIPWHPPRYALTATRSRGACGDFPAPGNMVPYYCPRNTTIYASTRAMARGVGNSRGYGAITEWHGGVISMMAHEYGHHVQHLSGLSTTWWQKSLRSSGRNGRLALSRRFELQATCLGAMFMRSVSSTYPVTPARRQTLYYFYSRVGDWPGYPRDHGSPVNNNRWFRQGYERNRTLDCNTWLAPASSTS
ncbi:neutral zinc metallopeptidase [Streptosporangium longisporum]|uniref:Peptidase n=1 Tax=Streptosporangium longisporum TaxID=46187 RepID=A0ABP6LFR0_9ACTN